jgi:hypothetical protein
MLPSRALDERGTQVKWRHSLLTSEARWRLHCGPREPDGQPASRPLTADEQAQMIRDIRQARAANSLLDVVSTWGLLQYLLAPASLCLGLSLLLGARANRPARLLGGAGICISLAAGALMLHRQYFSILGW